MSELQTDNIQNLNDEMEGVAATLDSEGADLAPDSAEEREEKDPAVLAQEKAQQAINKQHAKYREEERKRLALEEESKRLREELDALKASDSEIVIPPIPDQWDDDYEEKLARREAAILQQAKQEAAKEAKNAQLAAQEEAQRRKDQERQQELVGKFDSRIKALGLSGEEIGKAVDVVDDYGISPAIGEYLLNDNDGPLITKYLADNPLVLDEIRYMSDIQAAMKINSDIRQAASALRPQASSAPDPVETLGGLGASEKMSPRLKGVTIE